jgi:MFS family permease
VSDPTNPGRLQQVRQRVWDHPRYRDILLVNCLVGMFSTSFPATILTVSIKIIAKDLHTTAATASWVTTAPMLAAAVATPILGRLGDIRGHRRLYLYGFGVAIVFSLLTSLSWNAASLIGFRTLSQFGAAATVPSSFAMVFRSFPPHERMRASALSSAALAGAAVSGLVIGGPLVDALGWRPIFIIQSAIALVALLPAFVVLKPDDSRVEASIDYPGAVALAISAFTLTFGINRLAIWGPTGLVVVTLLIAPVAIWSLIRIERRAVSPILPLEILGTRGVQAATVASFVSNASWMGNFVLTPLLMQSVMGLSAGATSLASAPRALFITLSAPVASRLGMRHGERKVAVWGAIALASVFAFMGFAAATSSIFALVLALGASGWAFGHVQPSLLAIMSNSVSEENFGLATSLQQTAGQIGSVFGLGLFTALAADSLTAGPFVVTYLLSGGLALLAAATIRWAMGTRSDHDDVVTAAVAEDDGEMVPVIPDLFVHRPAD